MLLWISGCNKIRSNDIADDLARLGMDNHHEPLTSGGKFLHTDQDQNIFSSGKRKTVIKRRWRCTQTKAVNDRKKPKIDILCDSETLSNI